MDVSQTVQLLIVLGGGALLVTAMLTGFYANHLGFPFFPIFVSALFLGFPLVLLAVTVCGAQRDHKPQHPPRSEPVSYHPARGGGF